MQTKTISKKNGKTRTIYMPSEEEKAVLRGLLPALAAEAKRLDVNGVCHGFVNGRSPVTNALVHVGWEYTLTMDLKDFFDNVTPEKVKAAWPGLPVTAGWEAMFVDGAARQGLPTSPALANIAASPIDRDICAMRSKGRFTKVNFVYGRYADDLAFSADNMQVIEMLKQVVPEICKRHGFEVNHSKTKVQAAVAGRRMITGVAVGDHDITPPRWIRRRIRAGEHQLARGIRRRHLRHLLENIREARKRGGNATLCGMLTAGVRGLREWSMLRPPKAAQAGQLDLFTRRVGAAVRHAVSQAAASAVASPVRWLARRLIR